MKLRIWKLIKN